MHTCTSTTQYLCYLQYDYNTKSPQLHSSVFLAYGTLYYIIMQHTFSSRLVVTSCIYLLCDIFPTSWAKVSTWTHHVDMNYFVVFHLKLISNITMCTYIFFFEWSSRCSFVCLPLSLLGIQCYCILLICRMEYVHVFQAELSQWRSEKTTSQSCPISMHERISPTIAIR